MSRRKQSNPKPLKREDEEWGNESEAMPGEPRTPSSGGERPVSSEAASPASRASPEASPPRLRLNTKLATDPALAPQAAVLKHEPPSPSPPPPPPMPQPRDFIALSATFPGLFPATTALGYVCKPCGIRYSSLSTLHAHQEHYCTNRRPKTADGSDTAADTAADESSSEAKTPRPPGKQYACTYCSYSADKKVSLNRHMRMHATSPVSSGTPAPTPTSNGEVSDGPPAQDRYCTDCDIRFSSTKTFRAHKAHYCSTRQVVKQALATARTGSATSGSAPPSPGATPPAQAQYALALPTNPILIVPYSLLRSASTLPGTTLPDPDTPCFLLPNGTFQPLSRALPNINSDGKELEVLKAANRPREPSRDGGSTPLDLSIRRSPESVTTDEHEKENRIRSATPEQIVCAPSLPGSPGTPASSRRSSSPSGESSPKRRRRNSRGPTPKPSSVPSPPEEKFSPIVPSAIIPPALALRLATEFPAGGSPQVLVKQGVSKCKECNIVFCKYENYRIHKRHYCSAGGGDERASPAPPEPGPPPQYRQLICLACGIHFSSLDNLTTHQSYYCTKRESRSPRAGPETGRGAGAGAGGGAGAEGGWRCPCCDVVSPTAAAAQRHMEAHQGVKAFRCTICRYRGNTLRGMRTHIRMHFNNKKPTDLQEESYIACVLEEESRETTSPGGAAGAAGGERVHRCGACAYSSTYRGNVARHARLVHAADDPDHDEHVSPVPLVPLVPLVTPAPLVPPVSLASLAPNVSPAPPVDIKKEPDTETEETPNYCKSCDISFKYVNTYKAHKQFYCTANNQESAANNNVPAPPVARVTDTPVL